MPADTLTCVPDVFTAADARHWALLTRAALAARRTEIDDLNVFPVPDGDTGTNLYLTFDSAIDDVVASHEAAGVLIVNPADDAEALPLDRRGQVPHPAACGVLALEILVDDGDWERRTKLHGRASSLSPTSPTGACSTWPFPRGRATAR